MSFLMEPFLKHQRVRRQLPYGKSARRPGLTIRRKAEAEMFSYDIYDSTI